MDYEKLPFICNYCKIHGHLIRECPSRAKVTLKRKSPSAASPSTLDRQVYGPSGSDCMGMDPKVSVGKNLPAAESPELDPRVSVGKNLPAANSPDPDLRVESRVEDLEEPCSRKNKRLRTFRMPKMQPFMTRYMSFRKQLDRSREPLPCLPFIHYSRYYICHYGLLIARSTMHIL